MPDLPQPPLSSSPPAASSTYTPSDKAALLAVYNTWNSPPSLNWSSPNPCDGSWTGVSCTNGVVVSLIVQNQDIHLVPLDPAIGNLLGMQRIYLQSIGLNGPLPATLGQLTALRTLVASGNLLSSSLPPQMSACTSLNSVDLGSNQLTGSLPGQLSTLTNLLGLSLYNNAMSGVRRERASRVAPHTPLSFLHQNSQC